MRASKHCRLGCILNEIFDIDSKIPDISSFRSCIRYIHDIIEYQVIIFGYYRHHIPECSMSYISREVGLKDTKI